MQAGDRVNIEYLYDLLLSITNDRRLQHDILSSQGFADFLAILDRKAQEHA